MGVSLVYMVSLFCEVKTQIFDGIYWCCIYGTNNLLVKKQAKIEHNVNQTNGIFCHASISNTVHLLAAAKQ